MIGCNTDAGAGEGRKRTPSNWKAPIARDPTRRYPSAVCVIHSGPSGSIPSCTRHASCRYCVMRFSGSSASPFRAANPKNKSEQHRKTVRGILMGYVSRSDQFFNRLAKQTRTMYFTRSSRIAWPFWSKSASRVRQEPGVERLSMGFVYHCDSNQYHVSRDALSCPQSPPFFFPTAKYLLPH
jgi:hypothetical protein